MSLDGVALLTPGGPIRLKWHKLRDRCDRPPHSRDSLAIGLARGALLEVDLQATADGHWVCLHDATLEQETDGSGSVAGTTRAALEPLRQRAPDGRVLPDRLLFLDDLAALVEISAHGRVQIDLKGASDAAPALERFARTLGPLAGRFDIGGHDWNAVSRLAALAPGIRAGFDPCDRMGDAPVATWRDLIAMAPGAAAPMLYLSHQAVRAAQAQGLDLIAFARERGQEVDCWTIDPDLDGVADLLRLLARLGCRQITTNNPIALEALWRSLS